jgi:excisionase family DNA binding protein
MKAGEVCDYLKISPSKLYRLIEAGEIPAFRMGTNYRFNRETVERWRRTEKPSGRR